MSGSSSRSIVFHILIFTGLLVLSGCNSSNFLNWFDEDDGRDINGFYPAEVFFQTSFTQIKANPDSDKPAVMEAYVGLKDQYGDPIKGLGIFRFELYPFKKAASDPRGQRFKDHGLQIFDLTEPDKSQSHWDNVSSTYAFKLDMPTKAEDENQFVIDVTFSDDIHKQRLQDMLILKN